MLPITVILPVYHRVTPEEFTRSLASVHSQTCPPEEIIVVADGPIPDALSDAIDTAAQELPDLKVIRLPKNGGVAQAMRAGMDVAAHNWVARQDADDVSLPERFELLWPYIESGKYAAVGGAMLEFADGDPSNVVRTRKLPTDPKGLARYVKTNSPMNNPTVVFDAAAVSQVGGVRDHQFMEDYDLFARLIAGGFDLKNIDEPLVLFNASDGMFDRRSTALLTAAERQMQKNLVSYGLISRPRAVFNFAARQAFRALPKPVLKWVYARLFGS